MEFQRYWLTLKRNWLTAATVLGSVSLLTTLSLKAQEPIYESQGKIRFKRDDTTSSLTGLAGGELGRFDPIAAENNPLNTEMNVIRSVPIIQDTVERLDLRDEDGSLLEYSDFLRRFRLGSERGTDIVEIFYQDPDPDQAKAVVDTLMAVYLENHLLENRAEAVAARQFIEEQLPDAEASVHEAEIDLRQFKEANQVGDLEEEATAAVSALEDLRRRVAESEAELANANAESYAFYSQLGMSPPEAIAVASLSQSPGVQEVLAQLQEVESQLAVERVRFEDEHPMIVALEERKTNLELVFDQRVNQALDGQTIQPEQSLQIGELKADLIGDFVRSEVRRAGLTNQVSTLSHAQEAYRQRIASLPRLEQEQRELERQLEAAQSTYSLLLEKYHEIRVAENQNVGNARIMQQAYVSDEPVSPSIRSYLATGGIAGIVLTLATVLALDAKDRFIRTIKEARDMFGMTLLAVIPFHKNAGKLSFLPGDQAASEVIVRDLPTSAISETYRMLQANLKFLSSDHPLKTIVITSSVPQEGKSLVAANLAMAMAQSGHKVLLVDADMRIPRQHKIWDVLNERGLSNVIVEQLDLATVAKEVATNLDVLTAGIIPPNPTALLDSHRMETLIEQYSTNYRFVIIDTPALNVAADAPILGKMSDGVLLVTRPGVVDLASAGLAKERLEQSGQTVLGQVINAVIPEHEPYSHYYYTREYRADDHSTSRSLEPERSTRP
ncbi:MAG: polysaccharide biosynthesis tyrosine autokinase [Cyanobacteria bacterium CRU_2_1]|nr:polysaccharide biosynthesis tyrosine autokinase [Cyanobacteria bacterium CRU_2_1]